MSRFMIGDNLRFHLKNRWKTEFRDRIQPVSRWIRENEFDCTLWLHTAESYMCHVFNGSFGWRCSLINYCSMKKLFATLVTCGKENIQVILIAKGDQIIHDPTYATLKIYWQTSVNKLFQQKRIICILETECTKKVCSIYFENVVEIYRGSSIYVYVP